MFVLQIRWYFNKAGVWGEIMPRQISNQNNFITRFISENIDLYLQWLEKSNPDTLKALQKNFNDEIFRARFYSYAYKSIKLRALDYKKKQSLILKRENLSLNICSPNFSEENVYYIADPEDFEQKIVSNSKSLEDLLENPDLKEAFISLTKHQQLILEKYILEDKNEKTIAKELNISVQAVNKSKLRSLEKLKKKVGKQI